MSSSRPTKNKPTPNFQRFFSLKLSNQQSTLEEKGHKFLLQLLLYCLTNNPDYLTVLRRLQDGTGELFRDLTQMKGNAWDLFIGLDQETGDLVLKEILLSFLQKYEILEIEAFFSINQHKERMQRVQNLLGIADKKKLTELLSLTLDQKISLSYTLAPFAYFGNIGYKEGKLACAAIRHSKQSKTIDSYNFSPTLLKFSEFKYYLLLLKHRSHPLRARFLIASSHWLAGDIQIDSTGKAQILFLDSLGNYENININTKLCMATLASVFEAHNIFFSSLQRQYSQIGCSVFALDDMQHLFTLERYLKDSHGKAIGLFNFLNAQEKPAINIEVEEHDAVQSVSVHMSHLPISLLRTTQSRHVYNVIKERSEIEQETPINRKQETAATSVNKHFFSNSNERLSKKLQQMADKIYLYLREAGQTTVAFEIEEFSLHHLLLSEVNQLNGTTKDSAAFIVEMAIATDNDTLMITLLENPYAHPESWINSAYGIFKFTPLTFAIKQKNIDLITALLKHGANPNQVDGEGRLPIKLSKSNYEIFSLLNQNEDTPRPSNI